MNNFYSVYLSQNQSNVDDISEVLNRHLNINLTKVSPTYAFGVDHYGRYTMNCDKSRMSFTFFNSVTKDEISIFDKKIDNLLSDKLNFNSCVINKKFSFIDDKIIIVK